MEQQDASGVIPGDVVGLTESDLLMDSYWTQWRVFGGGKGQLYAEAMEEAEYAAEPVR